MKDIVIRLENLSKEFKLEHELRNTVFSRLFSPKKTFESIHALNNINLNIKRGDFIGVIGNNGSGKSTLLKIIAGILYPTSGTIKTKGHIVSFIELGIGFHPELTAKENVYLYASIMGLNKKKIDSKFDNIIRFSELESFVDAKLKTFSDGMKVRLAFSTAIQTEADIMLVDEVLAVGDINFQKKCLTKFEEFKKMNRTVIFVSHDLDAVRKFCTKTLYLKNGNPILFGDTKKAVQRYISEN